MKITDTSMTMIVIQEDRQRAVDLLEGKGFATADQLLWVADGLPHGINQSDRVQLSMMADALKSARLAERERCCAVVEQEAATLGFLDVKEKVLILANRIRWG